MRQELREMSKPSFDMIACAQEMQMFSQAYIQGGVQAFSQNAYEDLNEMVKSYRRLRKEIAGISKTMQEMLFMSVVFLLEHTRYLRR